MIDSEGIDSEGIWKDQFFQKGLTRKGSIDPERIDSEGIDRLKKILQTSQSLENYFLQLLKAVPLEIG